MSFSTPPELKLRQLLAVRSGIPGMYLDDGELQGEELGVSIDFLRESVDVIEEKLMTLTSRRLGKMTSANEDSELPLSDLSNRARIFAQSYESPHHFTMSVEGLRNLIHHLYPPSQTKDDTLPFWSEEEHKTLPYSVVRRRYEKFMSGKSVVWSGALNMAYLALKRDEAAGKLIRGEIASELVNLPKHSDRAVSLRPYSESVDSKTGYYLSHEDFLLDLEQDRETKKWSVFIRDQKSQTEAFLENIGSGASASYSWNYAGYFYNEAVHTYMDLNAKHDGLEFRLKELCKGLDYVRSLQSPEVQELLQKVTQTWCNAFPPVYPTCKEFLLQFRGKDDDLKETDFKTALSLCLNDETVNTLTYESLTGKVTVTRQ